MTTFALHPRLIADSHRLGRLSATHLLLHRNGVLPWLILVPETDLTNLLDLPMAQREAVLADCTHVSTRLTQALGYPKINVGWIGNLVPQLHVHVIGRRPGDACWPNPVWGHLSVSRDYAEQEIETIRTLLCGSAETEGAPPEGPDAGDGERAEPVD